MAILSERWVQAEPLRDVFDILAKEIPLHEIEPYPRHISSEARAHIESQLGWLKVVVKNRGVLRMLMEMINEDFPSSPAENLDYGYPPKNTMQDSNEHFCAEHCSLFPGTVFCDSITDMEELEGDYEAFDNSLIFPSLFGSAEF